MKELTLPLNLRLTLQKHYLQQVLETFPDFTMEELKDHVSDMLSEAINDYDEWDSRVDLEPEDHLHFKCMINMANWYNHLFTGDPIYFSSIEDRRQFAKDVLGCFFDDATD